MTIHLKMTHINNLPIESHRKAHLPNKSNYKEHVSTDDSKDRSPTRTSRWVKSQTRSTTLFLRHRRPSTWLMHTHPASISCLSPVCVHRNNVSPTVPGSVKGPTRHSFRQLSRRRLANCGNCNIASYIKSWRCVQRQNVVKKSNSQLQHTRNFSNLNYARIICRLSA
jgi:hypothetical protein